MPDSQWDQRTVLAAAVLVAAQALIDGSPIDDDGLPYPAATISRDLFCTLHWALEALRDCDLRRS